MSIESYDVEPVDTRGAVAWVLGITAAITGVLAVIGWPLPVVSRRFHPSDAWEQTVALVRDWWLHDGWRMSGASWLWGGIAIVATTAAIVCRSPRRTRGSRTRLLVLVPGGCLAALGPLVHFVAGVPWSNYSPGRIDGASIIIYVITLAAVVGLPLLDERVRRGGRRGNIDRGR
ncbi:hypothetical protein DEJ23_13685 [Curtobacterium sp. MCSS17_008]|uniref:hypothetical protein n=1 Tax=Curtobacterium sp. MCSS17_008 TaxID=2175647 RepID=UPI000DA6DF11|nr:hypothetical protein [Curtobacterium sp. MCSS17_008]PZF54074.1 hypothetical protein DEJ23_13685 [Curtobacterium sp. MCSS17_008]